MYFVVSVRKERGLLMLEGSEYVLRRFDDWMNVEMKDDVSDVPKIVEYK